MPLRDKQFELSYNSGDNDLIKEFYIPCFSSSTLYYRAVGFFTSGILEAVSRGLETFVTNSGRMKLLCSPRLSPDDIEAISKGYKDRNATIEAALAREVEAIPAGLSGSGLNLLSWLIANHKLELRIAIPKRLASEDYGIYHEKIGLFFDDVGDYIAFYGSNNETLGGARINYESFDVYRSWEDQERCAQKADHFNRLWENKAAGLETIAFPIAVARKLVERIPPEAGIASNGSGHRSEAGRKLSREAFRDTLWNYQTEAVNAFLGNSARGIFSMATGTGKTKTAVGAFLELLAKKKNLFVVVVTPQNTIARQWEAEFEPLEGVESKIVADGTKPGWQDQLADQIHDFKAGITKCCAVFTIYNTFCSPKFIALIRRLEGHDLLVIADEMHWAGADQFAGGLVEEYRYRLGLSATPERHMDEEGTDELKKFFGPTVYEFPLSRALSEINPATGETFLCPYRYQPVFVSLHDDELETYEDLTKQIRKQFIKERTLKVRSRKFRKLCEDRAQVVMNARSKLVAFEKALDAMAEQRHLLVYCSPAQIDDVQDRLNNRGITNHRFTGQEGTTQKSEFKGKSERDYILENFECGNYQALVAMKCLDEGINVLSARTGIILASTGNPKQYIQRRGRLLRRHSGKDIVDIIDMAVIPCADGGKVRTIDESERGIITRELIRYEEFASLAANRLEATNRVFEIKDRFGFFTSRRTG